MIRIFLFMFCLITFYGSIESLAMDSPPIPPSKKESLDSFQKKLDKQNQAKKSLETQMLSLKGKLNKTKKQLVDIAKSIQNNEKTLQALESRISGLEDEQTNIQNNLVKDRISISRLVLALERLRRVPPEALIVKPNAPLKTAQSAMLMRDIIPALDKQAEALKINLQNLEIVTNDLKTKKDKALKASQLLNNKYLKLSDLIDKRERLYASTHKDLKKQKENVTRISAQAKNLQDLVLKLENDRKRQNTRNQVRNAVLTQSPIKIPSPGHSQLPVAGVIRTAYNEKDAFGAPSKGISIEGRGGALVVAPMGGIIRFAGHFKNYGNMLIIEHKDGYHSLIAGLEKVDTVVGHSVSTGEPLGHLHYSTTNTKKPALYYELRHHGKAINPACKFSNLT